MYCTNCGSKNHEGFKFCSACGKPNNSTVNSGRAITADTSTEEGIEFVLRPKGAILSLSNGKQDHDLAQVYMDMVGAKYYDNVIFDAIFTSKRVLIRPVSTSSAHTWMLGALITPGLAQAADLIGKRVASFLSEKGDSLVGKTIDVQILDTLPSWDASSLYEVKQSLPSLWNSAGAILKFKKIWNVGPNSSDTKLLLVFDGSATPSKKQFLEFPHIAKICGYSIDAVTRI
jgi:hypothetical protein